MEILRSVLRELPEFQQLLAALDGGQSPVAVSGLAAVHRAHFAACLGQESGRPVVMVCADEGEAERMARDLSFLTGGEVPVLAARSFLFHNIATVSRQWEHRRLRLLYRLTRGEIPCLVATVEALLQRTLPYLSGLLPFSYEATALGELTPLDDVALVDAAKQMGVVPIMNITNLTPDGMFSPELAHIILSDPAIQEKLAANVMEVIRARSYQGLDVDFESIYAEDAQSYVSFISRLRELAAPMGIPVLVAVAPKSYANQPGLLYEGMDYAGLGRAADLIFLMTYEWGYSYGPPMAISPIRSMRTVIEYALKEIPAEKLLLGIPNYGYDWQIPYSQSRKAVSISNQYAVSLAARYYAAIRFDESVQAPWFRYVDERGQEHEVWFEDARSIRAKLSLVPEYGLRGVGYWNLMRPFPQNWVILNALYHIREGL